MIYNISPHSAPAGSPDAMNGFFRIHESRFDNLIPVDVWHLHDMLLHESIAALITVVCAGDR